MNILSTEQLIELIDAGAINASDIMGTRGIMNVSDWSHASPVTLGQLIKSLLGKIPETYWLVSVPDPGDYINKNVHFDYEAYEDIEAECREPQELKPFETAAHVSEEEPDAAVADEEPAMAAIVPDEEPAPAAVVHDEEPAMAAVVPDEEPAPAAVVTDEEPAPAAVVPDEEPPSSMLEGFEPVAVVPDKKPEAHPEKKPKRQRSDADFSPASGLGEWAKYKERALSTNEQNEVIKGMLDDGYSVATISTVIRTAQATVYNRIKKLGIVLTNGGGEITDGC